MHSNSHPLAPSHHGAAKAGKVSQEPRGITQGRVQAGPSPTSARQGKQDSHREGVARSNQESNS